MKIRSEMSRLWNAVFNPAPQRRSRRVIYSTCCRLEVLEDRDLLSVAPMQAPISNEQLAISQENTTAYCLLPTASDLTSDSDFDRGLTHPGSPDLLQAADTVEVSELSYSALKNAIQSVSEGGTITFSPSLAGGTLTMPTSNTSTGYVYSFSIQKSLTIDASGLDISIVGDGNMGIFTVSGEDSDVTIRGLTLTNGGT
ncbi:MAG: hypothetical protein IKS45_09135, partial [Thermoguttaceae bacterium]|nr:hypothetical protein [Thermoguttaceae bacterium]